MTECEGVYVCDNARVQKVCVIGATSLRENSGRVQKDHTKNSVITIVAPVKVLLGYLLHPTPPLVALLGHF